MDRYRTEKKKKQAENLYLLRQQGLPWREIALQTGMTYQNALQTYQRVCLFREQAFYCPFVEYIAPRTEKAIRKSLGEEMLNKPESLCQLENLKRLVCWPGVGPGVLQDLADALNQAGYDSFDPLKTREAILSHPKRFRRRNTPGS